MRHNFRICDSENDIICGKICDTQVLAKYAIAYAIACSHITNIPSMYRKRQRRTRPAVKKFENFYIHGQVRLRLQYFFHQNKSKI